MAGSMINFRGNTFENYLQGVRLNGNSCQAWLRVHMVHVAPFYLIDKITILGRNTFTNPSSSSSQPVSLAFGKRDFNNSDIYWQSFNQNSPASLYIACGLNNMSISQINNCATYSTYRHLSCYDDVYVNNYGIYRCDKNDWNTYRIQYCLGPPPRVWGKPAV